MSTERNPTVTQRSHTRDQPHVTNQRAHRKPVHKPKSARDSVGRSIWRLHLIKRGPSLEDQEAWPSNSLNSALDCNSATVPATSRRSVLCEV